MLMWFLYIRTANTPMTAARPPEAPMRGTPYISGMNAAVTSAWTSAAAIPPAK